MKRAWMLLLTSLTLPMAAQDVLDGLGEGRPGQGWTLRGGALALAVPAYPGSDETRLAAFPVGILDWEGRFVVGPSRVSLGAGAGWRFLPQGPWSADVGLGFGERRRESRADGLAGMGDRDLTFWAGLGGGYRWGATTFRASVQRALNADGGIRGTLSLGHGWRLGTRGFLGASLSATLADAEHMAYDFGITPEQAARRSALLSSGDPRLRPGDDRAYAPGGGLRDASLGFSGGWSLGPRTRLFAFTSLTHLADTPARSSLVRARTSASFGLGTLYTF